MIPQTRDPYMRDAQTILEAMRAKIPGLSQGLPPQRNLFGEPIQVPYGLGLDTINPFYTSTAKNDPVLTELARFSHGFTFPADKIGNVDLKQFKSPTGQSAYDRLMELQGTVKALGGQTIKDHLYNLIPSDSYKRLTEDGPDYTGSKFARLNRDIGLYKNAAKAALMKDGFPGLKEAVRMDMQNVGKAKTKGPQAVNSVQDFISQFQH